MILNAGSDQQVAGLTARFTRRALAAEAQTSAVDSARRNLDGERFRIGATGYANGDALFRTGKRLFERDVQRDVHVLTLARTRLASCKAAGAGTVEIPVRAERALTAADAFEDIGPAAETACTGAAEDVLDVHGPAAPSSGNLILVRRAILVVQLALLIV